MVYTIKIDEINHIIKKSLIIYCEKKDYEV